MPNCASTFRNPVGAFGFVPISIMICTAQRRGDIWLYHDLHCSAWGWHMIVSWSALLSVGVTYDCIMICTAQRGGDIWLHHDLHCSAWGWYMIVSWSALLSVGVTYDCIMICTAQRGGDIWLHHDLHCSAWGWHMTVSWSALPTWRCEESGTHHRSGNTQDFMVQMAKSR